jgi:hypothetical protein
VKFNSLRSFLILVLAFLSASILPGCGGGGASGDNAQPVGGLVQIFPNTGTFYAGIPVTFQVTGGRRPYTLSSSEPSLLAVPERLNSNSFTTVPNNPGVIDAGLEEDELPVRSVVLTARDQTGGASFVGTVQVAQNFLTGYGIIITPTTCPATTQACAGGESSILMQATFKGNLFGNQAFRFEVLRGNFSLRNPATGQLAQSVTLNSDHTGIIVGPFISVPANVPTQLAVVRVIHVPSGVYADHVFTISQRSPTPSVITAIPDTFTFTGPLQGTCGTGVADFFVFDGLPPYTAQSTNPFVTVTPTVNPSNPARFTVRADNPAACVNATIVITDSAGGRDTVTVVTEEGDDAPPEPPEPAEMEVAPSSITLGCGQSGSVTVVGGTGVYSANSTSAAVQAVASGNTVTISRLNVGTSPTTVGISITDGTQVVTVTATVPATCP